VRIDAHVDRVTVFERGARVTRIAALPRASAPAAVTIGGLPLGLLDDSVRITARGAVARSATVVLEAPGQDPALAPAESAALRAAKRAAATAAAEVERIQSELEAVRRAPLAVEASAEHQPPAPWVQIAQARRQLLALRQQRLRELGHALVTATHRAEECGRALHAASDAEQRRSDARSPRTGELRKAVIIDLAPAAGDAEIELSLEYAVRGARWAPSYVARVVGGELTWTIRASVVQQTGEDWDQVSLRLSTATLDAHTELPELAALKIGKRQAAPARRLRPPPIGAEALFADFDRDFPRPAPMGPMPNPADFEEPLRAHDESSDFDLNDTTGQLMTDVPHYDEEEDTKVEAKKSSFGGLLGGAPVRALAPSPQRATALAKKPLEESLFSLNSSELQRASRDGGPPLPSGPPGGGGGAAGRARKPMAGPLRATPPATAANYDYVNLVMAQWRHPRRGQLIEMSLVERYHFGDDVETTWLQQRFASARAEADRVEQSAVPAGLCGEWSHDFDYAFEAEARIDLAADGGWHSIPLCSRSAAAKITHVAVPREASEVFRVAHAENPFEAPILPGPVDVYDGDHFLVTAPAPVAAPGGELELPLGVDPTIKLARNVEFREEVTGMLRGGLRLTHELRIAVQNTSASAIELEVRERVPVPRQRDSDDILVEVIASKPAWQAWTPKVTSPQQPELRGGYRWKLSMAAHSERSLSASYEVRIPGKYELVGGNRREP
jgi:Domain of unknown function (DUF4139)/N-terminal domain of unknown function (DUF4140)